MMMMMMRDDDDDDDDDGVSLAEFTPTPISEMLREDRAQVRSRRLAYSGDFMQMIGELTYSLTKQIASKSDELRRLNSLLHSVQVLLIDLFSTQVLGI